jgi:Tol biopolymer transport system component
VAFAVGQSQNQGNDFGLEAIDIESGEIRSLTSERFFNIKSLAWLPDNPGLLVTAAKTPNRRFRIWEVSPHSGKAEPITNDSESYATLSLNSGTDLLISTQVKQDFHLALFSYSGSTGPRVLGEALHAAFFPNGNIVFSSAMSGNDEIWSMNDDGGHRKQLTTDPSDDTGPISSPGNEFIYFSSNRTGMSQVWRMRADGSNQTQVTQKEEGGSPIFVSPDGNWVYYLHGVDRKLWRVSADGGGDELVLDQRAIYFAISPDGEKVAFSTRSNDGGRLITIASLADGKVLHTISAAFSESHANNMAWMPDGGSILYVLPGNDEVGSSLVRHNLAEPKGVIIADLGPELIYSVAVSPDGKSFAVVRGAWKHDMVLIRGLK